MNFRMPEITGALGRVQLRRLDGLLDRMRAHKALLRAAVEDTDRGHLRFDVTAEVEPVARAHGAREHADVGDLLAGGAALDLEDHA